MRSLSAGLKSAQRAATGEPLVIVGLTKSGKPGYSYQTTENDSGRIFGITHTEGAYSGGAIIRLKNHDKALTNINFKGYRVSVGWGFFFGGGGEVSTSAPMYVWSQRTLSEQGELLVELTCVDEWERIARAIVRGETWGTRPGWEADTTVKACIAELLSDLGIAWHPDNPDSQANNYKPRYFVDLNTPARTVIRQLLGMTKCAIRVRADGFHLIQLTGGVDYTYDTDHAFYSDVREAAAPAYNYIIVQNREPVSAKDADSPDFYQGTAQDSASIDEFGVLRQIIIMDWVESNAEAVTLAECVLERAEAEASQGNIIVPMNCGQEIYDKVRVTDTRAGCTVTGRVGQLTRVYGSGEYRLEIRLGGVTAVGLFPGPRDIISDITGLVPWTPFQPSPYGGGIPLGGIGRWLQPIAVNIEFTAESWKKVSWTAGTIEFADGGSQSISAGSKTLSSYGERKYLYFKIGYNTLFMTSDFSTAACGNDRAIVALLQAGSDALQMIMILTFRGTVPTLNRDAIANGAITAALLKKTAQPWNCSVTFSGAGWNAVQWSSGNLAFADGSTYGINSGSLTGIPSNKTRYIYYVLGDPNLKTTSSYTTAIGDEKALLCIVTTGTSDKGNAPVILPMTSKGLTVNAVAIAADAIMADHIQARSIVSDHIEVGQVLAEHIEIGNLSVIGNADLGLIRAGEIRLGTGSLGNFTGWRLWEEGGYGYMAGYKSGSPHLIIGKDGIKIDGSTSFSNSYLQFWRAGTLRGAIFLATNRLRIEAGEGLDLASGAGASVNIIAAGQASIQSGGGTVLINSGRDWKLIQQAFVLPSDARVEGSWTPLNDLSGSLGLYNNRWSYSYINTMYSYFNYPRINNQGYVGIASRYWFAGYFNQLRYKTHSAFQEHDDIALIKKMKPNKKNPKVLVIPDEIKSVSEEGEMEDFIDQGKFAGLTIGTLQNLIARVEKLEEES